MIKVTGSYSFQQRADENWQALNFDIILISFLKSSKKAIKYDIKNSLVREFPKTPLKGECIEWKTEKTHFF